MKYHMTIKQVDLVVWWKINGSGKVRIYMTAMKYGTNEKPGTICTLNQFMKGYTVLKFLEKLEHFEQSEYKVIKDVIIRNVINNNQYRI